NVVHARRYAQSPGLLHDKLPTPYCRGKRRMRTALLVVAGFALIGFLAVAVVLPRMASAEAKEAAQALIAGADEARKKVSGAAERSGALVGAGKGVNIPPRSDPKHGDMKWVVSDDGLI